MAEKEIQLLLADNLPAADIRLKTADGVHFEATIITDAFVGKKTIERQRMVYAIVGPHITSGAIHALSLKTFTQQEWHTKCGS